MPDPAPDAPPRDPVPSRWRTLAVVIGVVALASVWPLGWALQHRAATALLVIGNEPTKDQPAIMREFPHGYVFHNQGHDGAGIYLMARHPFALRTNGTYLDVPSYRYRRIVYPMVAAAISPGPGVPLIVAMVVTSLLGVGLGAWALTRFPGAPAWLPVTAAVNPGVAAALFLSVPDALVTGLVLAAFAAMFRRHVALACAVGVVACLTRETAVLATLALALWPGIAPRARVALATIPTVVVAGWSAFLARLFHSSLTALPPGGAVTWPLVGWFQGAASVGDRLLSLVVVAIVLAGGVTRRRLPAPVRAYLLATVALLACSALNLTYRSIDLTRVAAPALPLAIWALTYRRASRAAGVGTRAPAVAATGG